MKGPSETCALGAGKEMTAPSRWYDDWQHSGHTKLFDSRAVLNGKNLARHYESFNDVRLLSARLNRSRPGILLEVGCATGEFYRYLHERWPQLRYYGIDISQAALGRAKEKYPEGSFFISNPDAEFADTLASIDLTAAPETIYAKDVIHHQTDPLAFLSRLVRAGSEMLIVRTRTKDVGPTVADPELSCQYHYDGWMPYIVSNLQELIARIHAEAPRAELVIYRNHMVLGGCENRFLPKECYLPETGTAETVIGVFRNARQPGLVTIEDRSEPPPAYTLGHRLASLGRRLARSIHREVARGR